MPTLKERVENNLAIFFLAALVAGFLSGIGSYQGILKISDRTTIAKDVLSTLKESAKKIEPTQRWIRIDHIETTRFSLIRLVISVNGINFSYPSQAVWAEVGQNSERFPLPISKEQYRISFRAFLSDPGEVPTYEAGTQTVDDIKKDQNALIRDMFANEKAFDIVKSYVQNGVFPDEFPIVVKENGSMVAIEGNRRLAALKALNVPAIVHAWEKKIKTLRNPKITKIKAVVAPNRDAAIKHIANKHTIDYRRPWKPLRQAYFYKSQIDDGKTIEEIVNEFPDHNVPRFWKMIEMHHLAKSIKIRGQIYV